MSSRTALNFLFILYAIVFNSCRLNELVYEPKTTPEQWCRIRPCIDMGGFIFNEPLGSFLVFLLAFLWVLSGFYFLKKNSGQKSRNWFGIALVLGGIGAFQAGISYQAFSYLLKCAGREFCQLTNGFEVGYSVTQAVSVSAMMTAMAFACTKGLFRKSIIVYSLLNAVIYIIITVIGVSQLNKVLLSFEVLMLFALPGILLVLLISGIGYIKSRNSLDGSLLMAAVLLVLVNVAYFGYYAAGITASLYQEGKGFYFSENDVLHVGMILWLWYTVTYVGRHLKDIEDISA
ncbi:MAG TPA: hypothetical protein PL048_00985 [Leptospiraceae bacterium]|nr:hypothetical protein [Leptospiraceae bacterium]HMZ57316.1 hypothetical protein [Leptospiraceae bacterium]HNF13975.1 hypothetical protein [Leptospiraceae bacterium]HNF24820.1 hypothetical protein [Leptospiraceae bacterium]HNI97403.1 hypothetical protein [Leptospiraceae bacterium]